MANHISALMITVNSIYHQALTHA